MNPIPELKKRAGSMRVLAESLGESQQTVNNWMRRGVPCGKCARIEEVYGIRCEDIHPNVTWIRDEAGRVTGYCVDLDKNDN